MRARILGVALAVVLAAGVGTAWAEEIEVNWTHSGSWMDTVVDINLDGTTANEYLTWAKGSPGKATLRGLGEVIVLGPTDECPYPLVGTLILYSTYIARFESGDLLFTRATTAEGGCVNPVTGTSTAVIHYDVIGGTGKYRGATGSFDDAVTFIYLLQSGDPLNPLPFAALLGQAEGFIYTVAD